MDHPGLVGRREPLGDLDAEAQRVPQAHRPAADGRAQRPALHELQRDEDDAFGLVDLVDDGDVA